MILSERTPWEQEVLDIFAVHLRRYHDATKVQVQASEHGESPQFADFVQVPRDATQEAKTREITALWAAVPSAVLATVRDALESNSRPETD